MIKPTKISAWYWETFHAAIHSGGFAWNSQAHATAILRWASSVSTENFPVTRASLWEFIRARESTLAATHNCHAHENDTPGNWLSESSMYYILLDGMFIQSQARGWYYLLHDIDNRMIHNSMTTFWRIVAAISVTTNPERQFAIACRHWKDSVFCHIQ